MPPGSTPPPQEAAALRYSAEQAELTLVLQAACTSEPNHFLFRRAARGSVGHPPVESRRYLNAVLEACVPFDSEPPGCVARRITALVNLAGHLETRGLLGEAADAFDLADTFLPDNPELLLHRARVARKAGDVTRARVLYDRVARLDVSGGCLAHMAGVGCALLAPDVERALGRAIRASVRQEQTEAAAVAQEARARARRSRGDVDGALRDYLMAAARFGHAADHGRIGHEMADLLMSVGDVLTARDVLMRVERTAVPEQRAWARARLLHVARVIGDEVGARRWAHAGPPAFVSLAPRLCRPAAPSEWGRRLERMMERLGG